MKADRLNTIIVLIDLQYYAPMNKFEETFGDNVSYQELEQRSYIEFKESMFDKINRDIKFRKYGRIGPVLTIKADMFNAEIEKFKRMLENNSVKFIYDWTISNVTIIKDEDLSAKIKLNGRDLEEELNDEEEQEVDKEEDFEEFEDI